MSSDTIKKTNDLIKIELQDSSMLERCMGGEYKEVGLWLSEDFIWDIVRDRYNMDVLIARKK